jgi:hypothetical protein
LLLDTWNIMPWWNGIIINCNRTKFVQAIIESSVILCVAVEKFKFVIIRAFKQPLIFLKLSINHWMKARNLNDDAWSDYESWQSETIHVEGKTSTASRKKMQTVTSLSLLVEAWRTAKALMSKIKTATYSGWLTALTCWSPVRWMKMTLTRFAFCCVALFVLLSIKKV